MSRCHRRVYPIVTWERRLGPVREQVNRLSGGVGLLWCATERVYPAGMIDPEGIRQRYAALSSILDERGRRLLVAAEAKAAGYGGIAAVWRATGVATSTIGRGLRELAEAPALTAGRVRRAGGGRTPAVVADP